MDPSDDKHRLEFKFRHSSGNEPRVPAAVLIQSLEGTQRALWLIAMSKQKGEVKSRARIPAKIERAYQLQCEIPKRGSYVMAASVVPNQQLVDGLDSVEQLVQEFGRVAEALANGAKSSVLELLPDASFRKRIVDCFLGIVPRAGSGWSLTLTCGAEPFLFDESFHLTTSRAFQLEAMSSTTQIVNGQLTRIDFSRHRIHMIVLGSGIEVECSYEEPLEDFLFERRRDYIQVTGRVVLNDQGQIKQMIEVESIAELDLSPIEISHFTAGGERRQLRHPLSLTPELDPDTEQHLLLEHQPLGIHVFAPTVSLLMEELDEQLAALWQGYAQHPDEQLTPRALQLKKALLQAVVEPNGGERS